MEVRNCIVMQDLAHLLWSASSLEKHLADPTRVEVRNGRVGKHWASLQQEPRPTGVACTIRTSDVRNLPEAGSQHQLGEAHRGFKFALSMQCLCTTRRDDSVYRMSRAKKQTRIYPGNAQTHPTVQKLSHMQHMRRFLRRCNAFSVQRPKMHQV